ncbi:MAG: hypothetical protein ABEH90_05945 [Halolamina sp.]
MVPQRDCSRREAVAGAAAVLAAFAGCAGDGATPTESPTDVHTTTETHSASPTETDTPTPTGTLSIEPIPPREADGTLTVYPSMLRSWLREVATEGKTIRAHAETPSYDPEPPLPAFGQVEFDDRLGDLSGVYTLDAEGDTRYKLLGGADEVSPPDDAEVTPVSSLSETRREFALAAIGQSSDGDARVYPETELGSWVRHEFFGGYFSHDGTTYRGKEAQQTDAEFFATEVWYVLSASRAGADTAPVSFRLDTIDNEVRRVMTELREQRDAPRSAETSVEGETAGVVRAFAEEHSLILTHDAVYRVSFEG